MQNKSKWFEYVQTLWPVFLFIVAFVIWAINIQTISIGQFDQLRTRVTVVEEQMPDKKSMTKIYENQAVMRSQLDMLTKNVDSVLKLIHNVNN